METKWAIDVQGLSKKFGDKPAVVNVALQVKQGEIYGFLGPNGSGKTTTMRMLCGLLTPDAGSGHCLGFDVLSQSAEIKRQVGYMTQHFSLYEDLTIQENLEFIAGIYQLPDAKRCITDNMETLGLADRRKQLAGRLSGGWKQRLALAAALLHRPKLLLLDEPTAGVDPKARRDFWNTIHQLAAEGISVLVSTHYMDEVERCHRLACIAYGHLLVEGSVQDVIDHVALTTWSVSGPRLIHLSETLRTVPGIEQTVIFGRALHVSGKDADQLEKAIIPYQTKEFHWTRVDSNLEDIFIYLVTDTPEGAQDD